MSVTAQTQPAKTFAIGGDMPVNRLGYGAMRITGDGVWGPPANHDEAISVLKRAVELGVTFIDTADSYGPDVSERLIAEALHPYKDGLVIATKGGFTRQGPNKWTMNGHPDHLRSVLEASLKNLKQDRIDLYQLHRMDPNVRLEDTLNFLKKAQEEGLVRHIGLSEVSVEQIKKAQQFFEVSAVQNMYSIDNRRWDDVLDYTTEQGMAFIPWYPLGGGSQSAVAAMEKLAAAKQVTPHQLALAWLLHRAPNVMLIPGTSKVKHLEENMKTADISLTTEELAVLNALR